MNTTPLTLNGVTVPPGSRQTISIPVARHYTANEVYLPVTVIHGRRPGPRLFVCAAIHGDEINGVEILRRLLKQPLLGKLRGALIAVPVVNVYGFVAKTRYMPDGRDLNRCFPGSPRGSLAARLAHTFMDEIVSNATHGIDLHTGSGHRANLPQVRASFDAEGCEHMSRCFGAPVILDAELRAGSLRDAVNEMGVPMIVYEGGEALRFDPLAIKTGLRGVTAIMRDLEMLPKVIQKRRPVEPFVAHGSTWMRAPESGILVTSLKLGDRIAEGEVLGSISDPMAEEETPLISPTAGVVIGQTRLPLVNEGDAMFHIGVFERLAHVADELDFFHEVTDPS